ncbi:MAG: hypothetical protein RML72_09530 [Bacteroidia bacterium]|nr:hypothetical protein [Bacteroidia bacterium]MDW8159097.1 hypothetical protein [Bacteroidia bacterium]
MGAPSYEQKLAYLWKWEGNVATRFKEDPGSLTYRGVTYFTWQKLAPEVLGVPGTLATFRKMDTWQWSQIVNHYWKIATLGNQVPSQAVSEWLHECLWVGGNISPVQKAINQFFRYEKVAVTGHPNTATLEALKEAIAKDEQYLVQEIYNQVILRYKKIRYPDYHPKAGRLMYIDNPGWFNRSAELYYITYYKTQTKNPVLQWIIGYYYPFRIEINFVLILALLLTLSLYFFKKYRYKKDKITKPIAYSFKKNTHPYYKATGFCN